ncbi:MAG: hypothetical protein A2V52_06735 [Actinobacteria bacterium RBG_19FT_COMBO_54_7]|uniref:Uncharacterized protein n=1 Tax=Candidatus Solincola sediminis TaxID=1797199 RepID=A0A1F2WKV3_9ACTN|nr:MAG: hypothetical protein A2Y75_00870 [Candidatus Solincola sediminis]OFW59433.1 MAG: hypothetical protein A2W01_11320 [Candidatus Solincola sediminis]OFW68960.1 MAG: hypothetical protein A2V52_06735 [Actinobacteria bacterium RBG_19FT_COMBO_54_7]
MSELETLFRIQELDIRIHASSESEENHPLKAVLERLEEEKQTNREELEKLGNSLDEAKAKQSKQESETQRMDEKLRKEEEKLYGGTVGNPKELRGLQAEVRAIKKQKDALETEILEGMERLDETTAVANDLEAKVEDLQAEIDGKRNTLNEELAEIRHELERLGEEKQGLRSEVSEDLIELYDELIKSKHSLAVVRVVEGVCTGCRVELPGMEYDRFLKSDGVFRCSNCRRILIK